MAKLIEIKKENLSINACEELEASNILFFPEIPFHFPSEDIDFLLAQKQSGAKNRKNISYKPLLDKVTNVESSSLEDQERLLKVMRSYSQKVVTLLTELLPSYAPLWRLDYASFRPFQEKGRKLRLRARNDLLHTDAFPTRPMKGDRILRFFTNINPVEGRKWMTSQPFEILVKEFGGSKKLPFPSMSLLMRLKMMMKKVGNGMGLPMTLRSPYDDFMLRMHHFLKENEEFQKNCPKDFWEFPPYSCWAVFTDSVSHAALAGQYALEQTIIIPKEALFHPEKAPIAVLEKLTGMKVI